MSPTRYGSAGVSGGKASRPAALVTKLVSECEAKYFRACMVASVSFCVSQVRTISMYCCSRSSNSRLLCSCGSQPQLTF